VEEATGEVEQYLDRAFLAGLPRVRIVHGMGMGVLRKALRTLMERHPHVALVAEASPTYALANLGHPSCYFGFAVGSTVAGERPWHSP
jgi:Smr domain